jgi:hypothetical protein
VIWLLVFILAALAVTAAVAWNLGYAARRSDEEAEAEREDRALRAHREVAEVYDQEAPPRLADFVAVYADRARGPEASGDR